MKLILIFFITSSLILVSFCGNKKPVVKAHLPAAVVELFTSEGCLSCPPADELLEEINKNFQDKNVLVLSYHVDYWDRLGWKDPFSNGSNTERQNYYAQVFQLNSIYTPQAIVNGKKEFVGSNKNHMLSALKDVHIERNFSISAEQKGNKIITVVHDLNLKSGEICLLFLVLKEADTKVTRGENSGRQLHHINIVQDFISLSGHIEKVDLSCPEKGKGQYFVAGIIQNKITGEIMGFGRTEIQ